MKKILLISLLALMRVPLWGMSWWEYMEAALILSEEESEEESKEEQTSSTWSTEEGIKELLAMISHAEKDVTSNENRRLKLIKTWKKKLIEFQEDASKRLEPQEKKPVKEPEYEEEQSSTEEPPDRDGQAPGYPKKSIFAGGVVAAVALWGGLTWWQKRTIANVLAQFGMKPEDLTQEQRNLLAATFNARYKPWALRTYAGKLDASAPIFNFPHAWQILQHLYFVRKPTRAKIAAFRDYMLRK